MLKHVSYKYSIHGLSLLVVAVSAIFFLSSSANAVTTNSGITYHGRILKPDGTALEGRSVQFKMQIRSPGGEDCLLYEETQTLNMQGSGGVFSITINDGTGQRTDSNAFNLDAVFANRGAFNFTGATCTQGTSYIPNSADGRRFKVSFRDEIMSTWEPLPAQNVNFVPLAIEAKQIGGFTAQSLVRVEDPVTGPSAVAPLTPAYFAELIALITGTSSQYSKQTVNGVMLPTRTTAPTSTTTGQIWFDSTAKQIKFYDGTSTQTVTTGASGGTVTGVTAGAGLSGGTITTTGTLALSTTGVANGTYQSVVVDTLGRVSAGSGLSEAMVPTLTTAGKVSGGAINTGTIGGNAAINTTGAITTTGNITGANVSASSVGTNDVRVYKTGNGFYISVKTTATLGANYTLTLPDTAGSNGQVLTTDGSGNLSWTNPAAGSITALTGDVSASGSGSVAATVNSVGTSTAANIHAAELLANASTNANTASTIVRRDASGGFSAGAVNASSYILRDTGSNTATLQAPTNISTSYVLKLPTALGTNGQVLSTDASGNLSWVSAASGSVSNIATGAGLTGGPITTTGTLAVNVGTGANQIVQLDASAKLPAVDGSALTNLNASNLASGALPAARLPALTGDVTTTAGTVATTIANNAVTTAKINNAAVTTPKLFTNPGANYLVATDATTGSTLAPFSCASGQTLVWNVGTGWGCTSPNAGTVTSVVAGTGLTGGPITSAGTLAVDVGTGANQIVQMTASAKLPAVDGSALTNLNASSITSGTISASVLPPSASVWTSSGSDIYRSTGNVGIGTSSPSNRLTVNDASTGSVTPLVVSGAPGTGPTNFLLMAFDNKTSGAYKSSIEFRNNGTPKFSFGVDQSGTGTQLFTLFDNVAGQTRFAVDPSGQFGIGTASPTAALDVVGGIHSSSSINANGDINAGSNLTAINATYSPAYYGGSAAGTNLTINATNNATPGNLLLQTGGGKVGIGTATPSSPLQIVAPSTAGVPLLSLKSPDTWFTGLDINNTSTGGRAYSIGSAGSGQTSVGSFQISDNSGGGPRLTIDPSGNIGIGTTAPGFLLEVKSSTGQSTGYKSSSLYRMDYNPSAASNAEVGALGVESVAAGSNGGADSVYGVKSTAYGYGTNTGALTGLWGVAQVGNGGANTVTTAQGVNGQVIAISGTATNGKGGAFSVTQSGGAVTNGYGVYIGTIQATNKFSLYAADATAPSYFAGNVGIGTSTPNALLDVNGTMRVNTICDNTGGNCKTVSSGWGAGGSVNSVASGTGLTGGPITTTGTLSVNVGTSANQIVQLDGSAKLPAVDGSALTGLSASNLATGTLPAARLPALTGDVTTTAGTVATTIANNAVTTAKINNAAVTTPKLFTNPGANYLVATDATTGSTLAPFSCASGQTLVWNVGTGWGCQALTSGTVTSVVAGTGLTGGTITGSGTLAVNVGTGASQIVQLTAASKLPAVDGSLLTNLNASNITSGTIPLAQLPASASVWTVSGSDAYRASGNVGIGNTSPTTALDITGSERLNMPVGGSLILASPTFVTGDLQNVYGSTVLGNNLYYDGSANAYHSGFVAGSQISMSSGNINFNVAGATATPVVSTAMVINNNGNVGIGTSNPDVAVLQVEKLNYASTAVIDSAPTTHAFPTSAISAYQNSFAGHPRINFFNAQGTKAAPAATTSGMVLGQMNFMGRGATTDIYTGYINGVSEGVFTDASTPMALTFATVPSGSAAASERMRISGSGNVGIGTTSPNALLDVNGTMRVNQICDSTGANCKTVSSGWGGSGTVTSVTAGTGLTGGPITSTGTLAVNVGTGANQIVQLTAASKLPAVDGSALTALNATQLTSGVLPAARFPAFTGDVTTSAGAVATTVAKIQGVGVTSTAPLTSQFLRFDGTNWTPAYSNMADLKSSTGAVQFPSTCTASQTLTYQSVSDTYACTTITGLAAGAITSGTIAAARLGSGTASSSTFLRGDGTWAAATGGGLPAADGTAAAPSISFTNSTDMGLFRAGAGILGIATAGSERVRVDASGKVGIATTNPFEMLHVNGVIYTPATLTSGVGGSYRASVTQNGTNDGVFEAYTNSVVKNIYLSANGASYLKGGNVGIGTASPGYPLDVNGIVHTNTGIISDGASGVGINNYGNATSASSPALNFRRARGTQASPTAVQNGDYVGAIDFGGYNGSSYVDGWNGGAVIWAISGENWSSSAMGTGMHFGTTPNGGTGSTIRMSIDPFGKVGIGNSSPGAQLDVVSDGWQALNLKTIDSVGGIGLLSSGNGANWWGMEDRSIGKSVSIGYGGNTFRLTYNISGAYQYDLMTMSAADKSVGFGGFWPNGSFPTVGVQGTIQATTAAYSPHVYGSADGSADIKIDGTSNVATGNVLLATAGGKVGIGTTTPGYELDVQGGGVNASGGYTQTSDIRLKTNVEFLDSKKALEKVSSLRGIYYDWKDQSKLGNDHQVGLIAQDVQKVFPEAVKKNQDGFLSVSYSNLVAPVIEAIKQLLKISDEHSREIASVKNETAQLKANEQSKDEKIKQLEQENAEMKARLDKIEKLLNSK